MVHGELIDLIGRNTYRAYMLNHAVGAAVVTGAGRGIGRQIALTLAGAGYDVGLQARSPDALETVASEIRALGRKALVVPGDVTERSAAEALVSETASALGSVRVAVAAAGQAKSAPLGRTDIAMLDELLSVNVRSVFHLIQVASEHMRGAEQAGRIVVLGSTASVRGARYVSAYAASKHAVLGLVRSSALELARHGITVNAVCPTYVDTPMFDQTLQNIADKTGGTKDESRARIEKMLPMGRVLQADEVAAMVAYLASEEAKNLTGQALLLDGGETL